MQSKWFHRKEGAIRLRKNGQSIKAIEKELGIPRSTLSNWFKNITLSPVQQKALNAKWKIALVHARKKAVLWHHEQKANRLKEAEKHATKVLELINTKDKSVTELALAMLYLGEGFKGKSTGMGNSNPMILKLFLSCLEKTYPFSRTKTSCFLHLRADQDPIRMKKFWSEELRIPLENFKAVSVDKRTEKKPTYSHYKGVCVIDVGNVAIQRRLLYLGEQFSEKIIT